MVLILLWKRLATLASLVLYLVTFVYVFERVVGLKPTTLALEGRCSNQLSYTRKSVTNFGFIRHFIVNEVIKPANNTGVSFSH